MKYETPELTVLTSAINAIQDSGGTGQVKVGPGIHDTDLNNEFGPSYADWE